MDTWTFRMLWILAVLIALVQATSQEIWVAVENRLQSSGGKEVLVPDARYLSGLAIQEDGGLVFWTTDAGKKGAGLYRIQGGISKLLYQGDEVVGFCTIHSGQTWLSRQRKRINNKTEVRRVFHHSSKKPSGLAYDPCSRSLFWTNTARGSPTVEVWKEGEEEKQKEADGSEESTSVHSRVLVSTNLTRPRGLSVDSLEGQLYWTDQEKNEFRIWRVGVDGEGRTLVCRGRGSEPFSLAVTSEHIYWSDWASHALYRIQKNGNCSVNREILNQEKETTSNSSDNSRTDKRCGSPWEYYCLQGSCLELEGLPLCLCSSGWEGDRCEREVAGHLSLPVASLELVVLCLTILSLLLLASLVLLSFLLHRYRKRPRIVRKRFISVARESKKGFGVEGSVSSCGLALEEGIQLDIENCCNMTLCDTPCFDPPSRVPKDLSKSKTCSPKKPSKLDRQGLLESDDNEEDLLS